MEFWFWNVYFIYISIENQILSITKLNVYLYRFVLFKLVEHVWMWIKNKKNCFTDDDSDGDLVTDYLSGSIDLNTKIINLNNTPTMTTASVVTPVHHSTPQNNNNMVPIISVTPHSPGTKYNCILGES